MHKLEGTSFSDGWIPSYPFKGTYFLNFIWYVAGNIEQIKVEISGKKHKLGEVAQLVPKGPSVVVVTVPGLPQAVGPIRKAIAESPMGLNPQQDGGTIFVYLPKYVVRLHFIPRGIMTLVIRGSSPVYQFNSEGFQGFLKNLRIPRILQKSLTLGIPLFLVQWNNIGAYSMGNADWAAPIWACSLGLSNVR